MKWKEVKDKTTNIKQFFVPGRYRHKKTKKPVECFIDDCNEEATWYVELKGTIDPVFLCFEHGEDC